jgi:rhamnosyl/mannosyltransferase
MESHLQALCNELKRSIGVEIIVANDDRKTKIETLEDLKVTRVGTLVNFSAAPVCPSMVRAIRDTDADIVHIHLPNPTATLAYIASRHPGRLVVTYHSDIIRQKMLGMAYWPILRHTLDRAFAIIVGSPNYVATSHVLNNYKEKCRVVPFGIGFHKFQEQNSDEVARIRKRFGTRIVLGVGRLVYYKGFEFLIRAMKNVDGHLLIIGDGPLRGELEREAQLHGLADRVTFVSDAKDVRPFYQAADVFALPSIARSEAFGIVQLEAMACGVPVVNTALDSGVTFVSQHDLTGLTVRPEDAPALGAAITSLLDDPSLRAKLGAAGRQRVEQEFSLEVMTRKTLDVYSEILGCVKTVSQRQWREM